MTGLAAKRLLARRAGMLIGGILGVLSGLRIFGLVLGLLLGYLVDELLQGRRLLNAGKAFLAKPAAGILDDHWMKIASITGLGCAVTVEGRSEKNGETRTGSIGLVEKELVIKAITSYFDLTGRHAGLVQQLVESFFSQNTSHITDLIHFARELSPKDERESVLRLFFTIAKGENGRVEKLQNKLIKEISFHLEIEAQQFNNVRRDSVGIDIESYEILGVSPDAGDQEVRSVFRRLAAQFHPDTGTVLEDHQVEESNEAFMRIKEAYRRIVAERRSFRDD